MATNLGETGIIARKAIKYGGIGLIFLMIGRVILTASIAYYKKLNPPPPPPPDVKFGKLPKLIFPQKDQPTLTYTLETRTGGLPPKMDTQFKVYFMPIKKANLLAFDNAKAVANRLEFVQEPEKLSATDYRFDTTEPVSSSLTMNTITGAFVLDRKWQEDPSYATPTLAYTDVQATDRVKNLLDRVDLLPEDVREGESTIQYLKSENGELVNVPSLSLAHFIQVNLYRTPVEDKKVINPRSDKGLISAVLALQREDDKQFVHLDYNYFPVELETSAVYPLLGVAEAWQRMQNGAGFIASIADGMESTVVRDVYIAYYDSDIPQQFMQPVYVFEGDNEFVGYVPAVSDAWIEGSSNAVTAPNTPDLTIDKPE
jgi:hypothetical protein